MENLERRRTLACRLFVFANHFPDFTVEAPVSGQPREVEKVTVTGAGPLREILYPKVGDDQALLCRRVQNHKA